MESLLLFRRALSSPTMCRFIPALSVLNYGAEFVSVGFEEVESQEWTEKVYRHDIEAKWDQLYKKPEYNPLEK